VTERWTDERPVEAGVPRARRLRREMTVAERRLWQALRKRDLKIRRQAPMGGYVADFVCHVARLVIEIDGYYHQSPERQARDAERDAWLSERGYSVLRIAEKDARERVLETVELIVAEIASRSDGGG
jgi:very-short-patch-repair endonuclease